MVKRDMTVQQVKQELQMIMLVVIHLLQIIIQELLLHYHMIQTTAQNNINQAECDMIQLPKSFLMNKIKGSVL